LNAQLRRAALRLLLLVALVFAGDRVLARAGTSLLLDSELRFSVAARGGLPPLVLVLGDSRAVNAFWTPELARISGERAFNLAYNGMSTRIAEALLRDYLAANAKPRMIVLEVSNVQDRHALSSALAGYWPVSPHLAALGRELSPRNAVATRVSHLFALNGEIFLRALRYRRRSDQDAINRFRTTPEILAAARALAPFELKAHADNLEALGRIVALARANGCALRLVVAPYLPEYVAHAANWDAWIATIEEAAGADARVWDYGRADADPAHFADRLHLNADGAVPFLERLGRDGFFAFDTPGPAQ
jgi:hypothetical protein